MRNLRPNTLSQPSRLHLSHIDCETAALRSHTLFCRLQMEWSGNGEGCIKGYGKEVGRWERIAARIRPTLLLMRQTRDCVCVFRTACFSCFVFIECMCSYRKKNNRLSGKYVKVSHTMIMINILVVYIILVDLNSMCKGLLLSEKYC